MVESQIFDGDERDASKAQINIIILMTCKGKLRSTGDSGYESRLQSAIKGLEDGSFLTISEAARKSKVCYILIDFVT